MDRSRAAGYYFIFGFIIIIVIEYIHVQINVAIQINKHITLSKQPPRLNNI